MRPTVLFYHQVLRRPRPEHYFFRQSPTVDQFRESMKYVRQRYHPISADQMLRLPRDGGNFPRRSVLITFDDGFRNNLLAAEILRELDMTALFFVLSDSIDTNFKPWYLRFAHILTTRQKPSCTAAWGTVSFDDALARRRWLAAAKEHLLASTPLERDRHLEQLSDELKCPPMDLTDVDCGFLGAEDLRRMIALGMTIGGHSASHDNLSRCDDAELHREMVTSREQLAKASGRPIEFFSYPDGRYDRRVLDIARRQYRMAFAASCHLPKTDLWRYPRRAADDCTVSSVLSRWYPLRRRAAETAKRLLRVPGAPKPA